MNSNIQRSESFLSDFALNSVREAANAKWIHTYDISGSISTSLTGAAAAIVHTGFFFGGVYLVSVGYIGMNKMKLLARKSDSTASTAPTDFTFWAPNLFLCAVGGYIGLTSWANASKILLQQ